MHLVPSRPHQHSLETIATGLVAVATCVALASCSTPSSGSDQEPSGQASGVTTDSTAQALTNTGDAGDDNRDEQAQCHTKHLQLSIANMHGSAGTKSFDIAFKNNGHSACVLDGYPGVSLVTDNNGTQLGEAAEREKAVDAHSVTLEPGATATSMVTLSNAQAHDPDVCKPAPADGLRVYPPNETASAFIPTQDMYGCASTQKLLHVYPVTSENTDTNAH